MAQHTSLVANVEDASPRDSSPKTPIAVLGTLAEFHQEAIPYDMQALVKLVQDIRPDLLCLDIAPEQWQQQDFDHLPPEYRVGLLPLAQQSDIVVVPVGDKVTLNAAPSGGIKGMIRLLRGALASIQRSAPGPDAVNQGWRHELSNWLYHLIEWLSGRSGEQRRREHTARLVQRVLETASRDPGSRILVVVNVQYCHRIRPLLRKQMNVQVVGYRVL